MQLAFRPEDMTAGGSEEIGNVDQAPMILKGGKRGKKGGAGR